MTKYNKFILGILALIISSSVISYNTTVRANAEETMQLYRILTDYRLPILEAVDKNGITWEYKELSDGTLFIVRAKNAQSHMEVPSQLNGKNVSVISDVPKYPEFKDYLSEDERKDHVIQSVKIPSTVKFIESGAFACVNLTDVQLPTTTWVGKGAFMSTPWYEKQRDSKGLIIINGRLLDAKNQSGDITIPSNVKEIAEDAFSGNMTSVTIPTSVTDIGRGAFSDCSNIKSIVIPNGITEIKPDTFSRCYKLEDVTIPNSVTKIGEYAFSNCSKLGNITIPDSVTEIDEGAFSDCSSLKKVKIPNNTQLGFHAFDDDVIIKKNGVSYVFKDINKKSSNTGNNTNTTQTTTSATNNVPQKSGVQQGWHKDGNYWNWLWSDGTKRTGWYSENGDWYYFYGNGQMAKEVLDLGGGFKYYLKPNSGDGKAVMATGGQYIAGDWYYFNPASDGYRGAMKRGWIYDGGNWYYFYSSGQMAHNTTIDGYYVNSSGAWVK